MSWIQGMAQWARELLRPQTSDLEIDEDERDNSGDMASSGEGGVGYQFSQGEVLKTFPHIEDQLRWVDNGTDAMYEHHEEWHWATGESAVLKFVTVHRIENGKITVWKDYWDMGALTSHAPASWLEDFAEADMSWIFDATGLV